MVVFFSLVAGFFIFLAMIAWFSRDLPTPGRLSNPDFGSSTKIYDNDNTLLYSFYKDYNRIYVNINQIPQILRDATVQAEDADFYQNQGFSVKGYLRALRNLIVYRQLTGGSTITQQLVKTVLLSSERSVTRKIRELILSVEVENRYSKDQILEMYLNDVSYGGTAVGVETASNLYFGKHVKDLTLTEAAFLAGLPQAPSYYSPYIGINKSYIARSNYVLDRLAEKGIISDSQRKKAAEEIANYKFEQKDISLKAPHFVMYVRQQLVNLFGENMVDKGNLDVKTTLDYKIQEKSEQIVKDEIDNLKGYHVGNGASIVLDAKTGAILSMVGSKDYNDVENDGNFNASTALRQPGSSTKPIMYSVAFEKGYTPASLIMDTQTDFYTGNPVDKVYTPVNYDEKYRGPVQIRFALGNSLNIPAVKMLARVGLKPVMQKAYEMGIVNWNPTDDNLKNVGFSLVLGGREVSLLQLSTAYSVFASGGIKREPYAIAEVKDSGGNIIYKYENVGGTQVLSEEITYLISHILLDNNARQDAFGLRSWLVIPGKTVAVKTGTTDQKRDNWTIGYTPSYVVGIWVGNNDNSEMNPKIASGITGASPIWNKIMTEVLKNKKDEDFQKPDNVIAQEVDAFSGGLPYGDKPKRTEYFIKGTEPTTVSTIYKSLKISKHQQDRLANSDEIDRQDFDVKNYIVFSEADPVSGDGKNRWQEGIDKWIKTTYAADKPEYYPPTQTSDYKYEAPTPTPTQVPTLTPIPSLTITISPIP